MKEKKTTEDPASRNRSKKPNFLGWLAPVLLLLALFLYFGNYKFQPEKTVSLERFWYTLVSGKVVKYNIEGNWINLDLRENDEENVARYKAKFPEVGRFMDRVQKFSGKEINLNLTDTQFLTQVEAKQITPMAAYYLRDESKPQHVEENLIIEADMGSHYVRIVPSNTKLPLDKIAAALKANNVSMETVPAVPKGDGSSYDDSNSLFSYILFNTIFPFLIVGSIIYFFLIRPMRTNGGGGGVLSFGRSRATLYTKEKRTGVTFADVAGIDEAKEEVKEIIEFLKSPQQFSRLGGRIPRGVLLVGPPGTGKTLLAKAIAGEADVPFFSISGSDFVEMFVGVGASRVRDLFKQAKENSPCILFLDEIDAVGRKRGSGFGGGGHDEREQTLNAILVEMDGFDTDEGIIVIASTNRPDVLDPALLRPGRFDREVVLDAPDYKGREEILKVHAKKVKLAPTVDLGVLARSTPSFSGADLAAVINEAAIIAAMKKKDSVEMEDLEEARDKIRFGRQKKSRVMQEDDRAVTAYHEGGHAIISCLLPDAEKLHKVTIIPRGMALGLTMQLPDRDRYTMGRRRVMAQIAVSYGGRLAEKIFCNDISTGAQNDIKNATQLARYMVTEWGMSDKIGPINYAEREGSVFLGQEVGSEKFHSENTAREIDEEVRTILDQCYRKAEELITSHKAELEKIAQALLKYETLAGTEVEALIHGATVEELRKPEKTPPPLPDDTSAATPAKAPENNKGKEQTDGLRGNEGLAPA